MGVNEYQQQSHENRNKAIEEGKNIYLGNPCKKCGNTEKYVHGWSCIQCIKLRTLNRNPSVGKKYRQSEKGKARWKRYKKTEIYKTTQLRWKNKDYKNYPEKYKARIIKQKHDISMSDYNSMLEQQDFRCAVCGLHKDEHIFKSKKYRLCVDHNHKTGKNRGLLCSKCNFALGQLEDINRMYKLIEYIKKYESL